MLIEGPTTTGCWTGACPRGLDLEVELDVCVLASLLLVREELLRKHWTIVRLNAEASSCAICSVMVITAIRTRG